MSEIRLTVEQVYLIQQLMRCGMTKEEIVNAIEQMDDEDQRPPSQSSDANATQLSLCDDSASQSTIASANQSQHTNERVTNQAPITDERRSTESILPDFNEDNVFVSSQGSTEELFTRKMPTIEYTETKELQNLKRKDDYAILKEIRKFVSAYNISQITIADMIRVSQGYVSRYMNGDFDQVSERVKNLVYLWYIECRSNQETLKQCLGSRAIVSNHGVLLPVKRDKFKFHTCHTEILESFFARENYPNNDTKKLLVEKCNFTMTRRLKRPLDECEKVTLNLVNNWFNNRRKQLKLPQNSIDT